tara:strand:- start:9962 stop:10861 length:900 start_codon:yes stop_codon:yes gene_type:complete
MRLKEIEKIIKGKIIKDGTFNELGHSNISNLERLLTFCDNVNFIDAILNNNKISSVITTNEISKAFIHKNIGIICSDNPRFDFFLIHNFTALKNIDYKTVIGNNTHVSEHCIISKNNVKIGDNCYFEEGVVIRGNVKIGNNVTIRSGSIIGGQGFQYWKSKESVLKINHFGNVEIADNVEIKEFCTLHLALFNWDATIIGEDTKIDAHTHIGHANQIGKRVYICSHANISGNSIIEDNCYIGPGVNIPNRLRIGHNTKLSVGATLTKNAISGETLSGNFAISHDKYIKHIKSISKDDIT